MVRFSLNGFIEYAIGALRQSESLVSNQHSPDRISFTTRSHGVFYPVESGTDDKGSSIRKLSCNLDQASSK